MLEKTTKLFLNVLSWHEIKIAQSEESSANLELQFLTWMGASFLPSAISGDKFEQSGARKSIKATFSHRDMYVSYSFHFVANRVTCS